MNLQSNLEGKTIEELRGIAKAVIALKNKYRYNKADSYFPDEGRLARWKYPVQMDLMRAGKKHKIRGLVGGNSSGKSLWNALESYYHLSGKYPKWWEGHRFHRPITAWICSINGEQLRDGIQTILFGGTGEEDIGTGVIAREDLTDDSGHIQKWVKPIPANCIAAIKVRHYTNGVFDGWSDCEFKVYEQGWASFQGATKDWISFDEEPSDKKVLAECLTRLRPRDGGEMGHFLATFTPTSGSSDVYYNFVPNGIPPINGLHIDNPQMYTSMLEWKLGTDINAPHLSEEYKETMVREWAKSDPLNIEARRTGLAAMGSGRVYPVEESRILSRSQPIPGYWKKGFGLDPGQSNFAAVWLAQDPNTGVIYAYNEYKTSQHVLYLIHSEALKLRGEWITGGIDPHEAVKPRDTGETIQSYFESLGVRLVSADGDPKALRQRIRAMLESGALKICDDLWLLRKEILTYRFDQKKQDEPARGQDDHLCDALMYAVCVFESVATSFFQEEERLYQQKNQKDDDPDSSGVNIYTGY